MTTLTILHTNDLHARFEPMTRLATLIQRERASARAEGRHLLLLDAGDSSSSDVWESDVTGGRANYTMLEAMGYDAAVIGNSDIVWDGEALPKLIASVHFVSLAANLLGTDFETPITGLRTHLIRGFDSLNIAVIGLTTHEAIHPRFQYADPVETLKSFLPRVQAEGAQLIIVLSHLGFEADQELAAAVPGLHLILGGHTHTVLTEPLRVGNTLIAQTGSHGNYLGRIDFDYDPPTQTVTYKDGFLIPCDSSIPPDPSLSGMLELIQFEAQVVRKKKQAP